MSNRSARIDFLDAVTPSTTRRMARTVQRDNMGERALRSALHRRGLRFRLHRRIVEGTRRTADIVLPRVKVAIFLDGCFWHGCPQHATSPKNNANWWRAKIDSNIARDRDTNQRLAALGWIVLRFWTHEDFESVADRIVAIVNEQRRSRGHHRPARRGKAAR
jgi:DNA mismatch endonuclease (patch repair protein)